MGKGYQGALLEFGETVDKADAARYEGMWLGKDTAADESIEHSNGSVQKVRVVKKVPCQAVEYGVARSSKRS